MFSEWPRQTPKHKKQKLPLLLSRANSRHRFGGHVPLNLPLPVWTKTTLPADALQQGPVGAPHGQWPFHTASGQSGSLSSPWSNTHHHHHHFPPSAPFLASLDTQDLMVFAGRCWSLSIRGVSGAPRARGVSPGLIRRSMMKWSERPQPQSAPASNHSSLNWKSSSQGPTGVKSWITFLFLSLSNYLHPLTCSVSLKLCMARLSSLLLPRCHPSPSLLPASPACLHRSSLYYSYSQTTLYCTLPLHSPETSKFNTYNLQLSVASHLTLSMFLSRIVSPSFSSCVVIAILSFCLFNSSPHQCPSLTADFFLPFFLRQDTFKSFIAIK